MRNCPVFCAVFFVGHIPLFELEAAGAYETFSVLKAL